MSRLSALVRDERGDMATTGLGFALTWFVVFFVFLMNVQLGQLCHRRDAVDHATSLAADTAKKTYCAKQENASATEQEARRVIEPVMETATGNSDCKLSVRASGGADDPGAKRLDVALECSFVCKVPIAAQVMCSGGKAQFDAKLETVALGCDGKGS